MSNKTARLEEIHTTINNLVDEAFGIVRENGTSGDVESARSYWVNQIRSALGSDDFPTHATTLLDTVDDLNDGVYDDNWPEGVSDKIEF